ncbi:cytochrome P450 [Mycena vulgaris]|nr:cytochrome P450 [Mycena vulgaris]
MLFKVRHLKTALDNGVPFDRFSLATLLHGALSCNRYLLAQEMAFLSTDSVSPLFCTKKPYAFIPGPTPSSALGYLLDLHSPDAISWHLNMPEEFGHVARLRGGLVGADALYITDPAALNAILIRQQAWFPESTEFAGLFGVIHCGDGVASVQGPKQRKHMDALFTPSRVSKLMPLFYDVTRQLELKLTAALMGKPPGQVINILDYLTRAALEMIGTAGIGHTFNSFDDRSRQFDEFHGAITNVLPLASRLFLILPFLQSWRKMRPVWLRRTLAALGTFLWPAARKFRAAVNVMNPVYVALYNARRTALEEGGSVALTESIGGGKDLMTAMIQANWEADEKDRMDVGRHGACEHGVRAGSTPFYPSTSHLYSPAALHLLRAWPIPHLAFPPSPAFLSAFPFPSLPPYPIPRLLLPSCPSSASHSPPSLLALPLPLPPSFTPYTSLTAAPPRLAHVTLHTPFPSSPSLLRLLLPLRARPHLPPCRESRRRAG